jgi:hypothetical protein
MLEVSPVRVFAVDYRWLTGTPGNPAGAAVVDPERARPAENALDEEIPCTSPHLSDGEAVLLDTLALELLRRCASTPEARRELRSRDEPTLPSTIGLERRIDPFLRCRKPPIRAAATTRAGRAVSSVEEVFAVIRSWQDGFR